MNFLRRLGGVRDDNGDVNHLIGGDRNAKGLKGLINPTGKTLDEAALRAWEDGYFPDAAGRPTVNDLLEALEDDLKGSPRYSHFDANAVDEYQTAVERNAEIERLAARYDIPLKGVTREQFFDLLNQRLSDTERAEVENQIGEDLADANARMEADAAARAAMGEPRSLEDLERERDQEIAAANAEQRAVSADQPERQSGEQGGGEGGAGQGGNAAEPTGRAGEGGERAGGGIADDAAAAAADDAAGRSAAAAGDDAGATDSRLIDKAGNIRLELLDTTDDVKSLMRQMAADHGDYDDARRGVVSDAEVASIADAIGAVGSDVNIAKLRAMSVEDGVPMAARIRALRTAVKQQSRRLIDAMRKADASGDPRDLFAVAAETDRLNLIQETLSGVTAEVGRGLRAFRDMAAEVKQADDLGALMREVSGGRTLDQIKRQVQLGLKLVEDSERDAPAHDPNAPKGEQGDLGTAAKLAKWSRDSTKPDFWDKVVEFFINNLLSNWATHITYAVGNEVLTLWKAVPETAFAALGADVQQALGMTVTDRRYWGEVGAGLYALGRGSRLGLMAAGKALWTGEPVLLPREKSVSLALQERHAGAIGGVAGKVVRGPTRMVAGIHALSRFQSYSMSISQQAYRQAMSEGLAGEAFIARVAQLEQSPNPDMILKAHDDATQSALMGRGGEFAQAVVRLSNSRLMGTKIPKLIIPFAQVSANVITQGLLERTVLGLLAPDIRARLRVPGAERDTQIARIVAGTGLAMAGLSLAISGNLTGAEPPNPRDRDAWRAMGNQPYAIKVGDTRYQYGRLGALAKPLGLIADLYQVADAMSEKDVGTVAAMISLAMSKLVLDESSMRGISDAMNAVANPKTDGMRWIKGFAVSFIPYSQAVGQVAREVDPLQREARTILDAFRARLPGLSESLPARIDVWGQPVPQGATLGGVGLSSIYTSRVQNDPTTRVLAEMQLRGVAVWPSMPERSIRGVPLTDQQYEQYARLVGQQRKRYLDNFVPNPGWQSLSDGAKAQQVREALEAGRRDGEMAMLAAPNGILQSANALKRAMIQTGQRHPATAQ